MPRSPKLAISNNALTTTTTVQTYYKPITLPLAHARGVISDLIPNEASFSGLSVIGSIPKYAKAIMNKVTIRITLSSTLK